MIFLDFFSYTVMCLFIPRCTAQAQGNPSTRNRSTTWNGLNCTVQVVYSSAEFYSLLRLVGYIITAIGSCSLDPRVRDMRLHHTHIIIFISYDVYHIHHSNL